MSLEVDERFEGGLTRLMFALRRPADPRMVPELLRRGASLTIVDDEGRSALHHAYLGSGGFGGYKNVATLRNLGADPMARDHQGLTPLLLAASHPVDTKAALFLITSATEQELEATDLLGRDTYELCRLNDIRIGDATWALLLPMPWLRFNLAVLSGRASSDVISKSLEAGGHVGDLSAGGSTCLRLALDNPDPHVFPLLLLQGPDLEARDKSGRTVLFAAVENPSPRVVETKLLLRAGAQANATDAKGMSPLHLAVRTQNLQVIQLLLDFGGRPELADAEGKTPFEVACCFNSQGEILTALSRKIPRKLRKTVIQQGLRRAVQAWTQPEISRVLVNLGAVVDEEILTLAAGNPYLERDPLFLR